MLADPRGKCCFVDIAGGDGEHRQNTRGIVGVKLICVEPEKKFNGNERRALVAIDERMVSRNAKTIGSGEISDVEIAVGQQILRAGDSSKPASLVPSDPPCSASWAS
jgi:hypothetical protein